MEKADERTTIHNSYTLLEHNIIIYNNPGRINSGRRRITGAVQDNPAVSGPVAIMLNTRRRRRRGKKTRKAAWRESAAPASCTRYVGYVKKCLSRTSETGRPPLSHTHI